MAGIPGSLLSCGWGCPPLSSVPARIVPTLPAGHWTPARERGETAGVIPNQPTRPTGETPAATALRRSQGWHTAFIILLVLGLIGAAILASQGSRTTDLYGDETRDGAVAAGLFAAGVLGALLTALPFLAFSHILDGHAELLRRGERAGDAVGGAPPAPAPGDPAGGWL